MTATAALVPEPLPLREDADGAIRVAGTRVTLDSVVQAFDEGATPEEIVQQYPVLPLRDVYAVIGHVLGRRSEIDGYLERRIAAGQTARATNEARSSPTGLRARLAARRGAAR